MVTNLVRRSVQAPLDSEFELQEVEYLEAQALTDLAAPIALALGMHFTSQCGRSTCLGR